MKKLILIVISLILTNNASADWNSPIIENQIGSLTATDSDKGTVTIPIDMNNRDYKDLVTRWTLIPGNTIQRYVPPTKEQLDVKNQESLLERYEFILQKLIGIERALQIHPGNSKLQSRKTNLLTQEQSIWTELNK